MRAAVRARVGSCGLWLCLTLAASTVHRVSAQQSADQVVLDLNHSAMEAYNNMDINQAGSKLEEALRVAAQGGVVGPLLAQTNMNLAIIYIGGLGDNDSGVRYFADAICADPSAQLDPLTSTPDIQSVFQVAAQRVGQQGCPNQGAPNIGPGAAAQTMPMQQQQQMAPQQQGYAGGYGAPPPPNMDGELPPGWGQSDAGGGKAKDFKRGFVQLGLTIGMPYVGKGMLADRDAPDDRIFITQQNGGIVRDPDAIAMSNPGDLLFAGSELRPGGPGTEDVGAKSANAWEPDADSYDSLPEPYGGNCAADGKETGPTLNTGLTAGVPRGEGQLRPSRYCVRVKSPGFAPQLAMRAAVGYFVTRDVSLALITRFQFSAGQGSMSHLLLGARAEYMFTKQKARGLMVSGFLGATFGQIQAQPSADGATGNEPWIKSGLQGAHIGTNIRYRFTNNIGMFMAPELDVQLPTFLWNIDLTVLGGEFAF
jgi:hypothetical protein